MTLRTRTKVKSKDPQIPRLLTISEAMTHYGMTDKWWRERIWSGQIPRLSVSIEEGKNKKIIMDRCDIDRFIEQHKETV